MQAPLDVGQDLALTVFGQVALGIRLGAHRDPDSRVQFHNSSLFKDSQSAPDGLRRYVVPAGKRRAPEDPLALVVFPAGNPGGDINGDVDVACEMTLALAL